MDRVRHARIPVHLDAVLIGEKTVPKGCKVRNVSNQGLLLECDPDGRILTFRDGDHVDIHLLFQRPEGTKYQTITAIVRHVAANGIGVEFCQSDAGLVKLIESYRVDDSQSIEATITRHRDVTGPRRSASVVSMPLPESSARTRRQHSAGGEKPRGLFYLGLLSIAIAVIIFTVGYLSTFNLITRVSDLETFIHARDSNLATTLQSGLSSPAVANADENDSASGTATVTEQPKHERSAASSMDSDAGVASPIAEHSEGQSEGQAVSDHHPTDMSDTEATAGARSGKVSTANLTQRQATGSGGNQVVGKNGPWIINLMSSPNKSDADRFAEEARRKGIQVQQTSAMLRDREFFRVQVTGFQTATQARESAGPVKERLGLEDVWIFKR